MNNINRQQGHEALVLKMFYSGRVELKVPSNVFYSAELDEYFIVVTGDKLPQAIAKMSGITASGSSKKIYAYSVSPTDFYQAVAQAQASDVQLQRL